MTVTPLPNPTPPVMPSIEALRINGMQPFLSHADCANTQLSEAHALLTLMAATFRDTSAEGAITLNPEIIGAAFDGVASLVALAMYHGDCAQTRRAGQ